MLLGLSGTFSGISLGLQPRGITVDILDTEVLPERLSIAENERSWRCRYVVEYCSREI